jgi:hypothetical protein
LVGWVPRTGAREITGVASPRARGTGVGNARQPLAGGPLAQWCDLRKLGPRARIIEASLPHLTLGGSTATTKTPQPSDCARSSSMAIGADPCDASSRAPAACGRQRSLQGIERMAGLRRCLPRCS